MQRIIIEIKLEKFRKIIKYSESSTNALRNFLLYKYRIGSLFISLIPISLLTK